MGTVRTHEFFELMEIDYWAKRTSWRNAHRVNLRMPKAPLSHLQLSFTQSNQETTPSLVQIMFLTCAPRLAPPHAITQPTPSTHPKNIPHCILSFTETKRNHAKNPIEIQLSNCMMGSVGIILRVPLKREWYPGLKDCRVLEYDTEQQVYG